MSRVDPNHEWFSVKDVSDIAQKMGLVVIDPEDAPNEPRRFLEHLSRTWAAQAPHEFKLYGGTRLLDWLASHFPTPKPPKPEEPKGLGAVVEDADGSLWFRMTLENQTWAGEVWQEQYGGDADRWTKWESIDAVRVLSEGVQP